MLNFKLALKNLLGAGIRTWLNVIVLSVAFVAIIWTQGLVEGMNKTTINNMKRTIYGGGQFRHQNYDPYDPLTIEDSHGSLTNKLQKIIDKNRAVPILITRGALYPHGRMKNILIKGIPPKQDLLDMPMENLSTETEYIPAVIGNRMASQTDLKPNDIVTVRWRDKDGTFDAADIQIVNIMKTPVPAVDNGQIWVSYKKLQEMMNTKNHATLVVTEEGYTGDTKVSGVWEFKSLDYLLRDLREIAQMKTVGSSFMYLLLLLMGLLALFDTQVLSIFRRKREIGTLMALGMERSKVISLFTLEGALHGILAFIVGGIWGIPLMVWTAKSGIALPELMGDFGLAMASSLYPSYGWKLVIGSIILVLVSVTIVSYLPARKISDVEPKNVLSGRE